mgnify:CR=1 FL=1
MSDSAPKRRWFRFSLTGLLICVAIVAVATHWGICVWRANTATADAESAIVRYQDELILPVDVVQASQEALEADLTVPMRSSRAAYESHMRRMGRMRLLVEGQFPVTGAVRPIVEFTSHYELARRKLIQIAGEDYADQVDGEFDFPYRDQFEGHPAAERSL